MLGHRRRRCSGDSEPMQAFIGPSGGRGARRSATLLQSPQSHCGLPRLRRGSTRTASFPHRHIRLLSGVAFSRFRSISIPKSAGLRHVQLFLAPSRSSFSKVRLKDRPPTRAGSVTESLRHRLCCLLRGLACRSAGVRHHPPCPPPGPPSATGSLSHRPLRFTFALGPRPERSSLR